MEAKIPAKISAGPDDNGISIYLYNSNTEELSKSTILKVDTSHDGVMSSEDKSKLNGIAAGAQVNVIENITIDGSTAGVSVSGKTANISMVKGVVPTDIRISNGKFYLGNNAQGSMYKTSIQFATPDAAGFMSSTDKAKLTRIADGAQVNVIESVKVNGTALSVSEKSVNIDLSSYAKSADTIHVADVTATATDMNLKMRKAADETPICNVIFNAATTSAAGLMSAADKSKLDGIVAATDDEIDTIFAESIA